MEIPQDKELIAKIRSKDYAAYRRTGVSDDFINGHIQGFADCYNWLVKLERESQNASNESSALPISDVVKSLPSELGPRSQKKCFMCGKTDCSCHDKW